MTLLINNLDSHLALVGPIMLITGMITDRIGVNSVLLSLQIHLLADHTKKTMKVIYTLSIAFNIFCFVHADGSAIH